MRRSVFLVLIKRKRLNNFQLKELSKFFFNAALAILASLVLKFFEPEARFPLDRRAILVLFFSLLGAAFSFWVGLFFASKVKGR